MTKMLTFETAPFCFVITTDSKNSTSILWIDETNQEVRSTLACLIPGYPVGDSLFYCSTPSGLLIIGL